MTNVPTEETNRVRRCADLFDSLAIAITMIDEGTKELVSIAEPSDIVEQVQRRLIPDLQVKAPFLEMLTSLTYGEDDSEDEDEVEPPLFSVKHERMDKLLDRLFSEAPRLERNGIPVLGQAPALEAHIMLRPGTTIQGILSRTPEGLLRMLTPTNLDGKKVLAEQFFDADDVVAVVLVRDVTPGIIS